jgi:transposase
VSAIARDVGVSRDTVYRYLRMDDLSPKMPAKATRGSRLDPWRPLIESWLDEDRRCWRKQRHTAHRIWVRLTEEEHVEISEVRVRQYVAMIRRERGIGYDQQFLDLDWAPGIAQADFGEADFYVMGARTRLSYFVLSFPFSNVGVAQVFASENAECVCQALRNIFEFLSGVPTRIVFDNATGVGRRVCGRVSTTETFSAFAAHYGFDFRFCNPESGHEKSNVERKVGYIRDNLFVPLPRITSLESYNARLMGLCMGLSEGKDHWRKGEPESQLFVEDSFAMQGLPERPFRVVRWVRPKANRQGKFSCDGPHFYSSDPSLAGQELVVGVGLA